ncbi:MAG TPA: DUF1549 domain-containing protein, partial [Isosphaeraceae bacterium]|nr:DUF1549 domain-containing protein [Isosphaeraceae bacterium]
MSGLSLRPSGLVIWGLGLASALAPGVRAADDPKDKLPPAASRKVDFARDIRPIFAHSCFACHGPEIHKSGLRLDHKQSAFTGGDSGPAFEPGKSAESLLIEYVAGLDPDTVMPPKGKGDRLTPEQVSLLRAWIDQGARWPDDTQTADANSQKTASDHWSFQPIKRQELPPVKDTSWARSPIDAFVLAKLEAEELSPSPEADRSTLIRRLSLDLLGLPPLREEVNRFLNDPAPDAYEQLVDRLLASPYFGERWGRHWLDLARYADSDGYEKDSPRPNAWRFRNWVIDALNRDMPFDRFTIEQLAGDLLPNATLQQKTATGFHRNTLTNREGGVDQEEYRVAAVLDRVNTTGTVWLGLTVGCAQCHTHKYDPILQREYYGLFAFFNNGQEVDLPAPLPGEAETYAKAKQAHDLDHAQLEAAKKADDLDRRPARQAKWVESVKVPETRWQVLTPHFMTSAQGAKLTKESDGSILASGSKPDEDTYTITFETDLAEITAFRIEALDDSSLPARGPGRVKHGNFVLSEIQVKAEAQDNRDGGESGPIRLCSASADFEQDKYPAAAAIDGDPKTGWAIAPQVGKRHVAVFQTERDAGFPGAGARLVFVLDQRYGEEHTLGRFRISATTSPRPVAATAMPDDVVEILALESC